MFDPMSNLENQEGIDLNENVAGLIPDFSYYRIAPGQHL